MGPKQVAAGLQNRWLDPRNDWFDAAVAERRGSPKRASGPHGISSSRAMSRDAEAARGMQTRNTQNQNTGERLRKEKHNVQQQTVLDTDELFSCRGSSLQRLCCRVI
jgi:hypothetical protein